MKQLLLTLASLLVTGSVTACSCAWAGRPCTAVSKTDAVFTGRVTHIRELPAGDSVGQLVRIEVLEAFKGVSDGNVEVMTGYGGSDCGIRLRNGEEYVVYASLDKKTHRLSTTICMRTRKLSEASEDIAYLRRMHDPQLGRGILGQIERLKRLPANGTLTEHDGMLPGARVVIHRGAEHWETRTGNDGQFYVWGLGPGTYRLQAQLPPGYVGGEIREVEINLESVCSEVRILALPEWKPPAKK